MTTPTELAAGKVSLPPSMTLSDFYQLPVRDALQVARAPIGGDVSVKTADGKTQTWSAERVKLEVTDPLAAHRDLLAKYTDADIHNLTAYLVTLK
jgi:hypothetical protein